MTAKAYLNSVFDLDMEIQRLIREKEQCMQMAFSITNNATQPHYNKTRRNSATYTACIEKADALERIIEQKIDDLVDLKSDVVAKIMQIDDLTCRDILRLRYLEYVSWEDIAAKWHFTVSWAYKKNREALDKMEQVLNLYS